ncbi:hypothetical protein GCM10023320_17330 [Pseudonocardia adelaidensis]|uniref:Membrane protein YesL n=2 Tax=Pseudonocardia adelaidensis TaxID=648754 RepID=A0ABP9NEU9_9PSEU
MGPDERAARTTGWEREARGWAGAALRGLEFVAYPAIAGAAFCLLALGVVTWLPALGALASALHRWRRDGDTRCFTGVLTAFPGYWRALWRHALVAAVVPPAMLVAIVFLAGRPEPVSIPLLAVQVGGLAVFAVYHLALAVVAGADPGGRPAWRARALVLAFGSPRRGLVLLAALLVAPVLGLPLVLGPLLFGPSLPVLCGLVLVDRVDASR